MLWSFTELYYRRSAPSNLIVLLFVPVSAEYMANVVLVYVFGRLRYELDVVQIMLAASPIVNVSAKGWKQSVCSVSTSTRRKAIEPWSMF